MTTVNDMNKVIKQKDDAADALRADYEKLKEDIFDKMDDAVISAWLAGKDVHKTMKAMERYSVLEAIVSGNGLYEEYAAWKKAKEAAR